VWATRNHSLARMLTSTSPSPLGQGRVLRHVRKLLLVSGHPRQSPERPVSMIRKPYG